MTLAIEQVVSLIPSWQGRPVTASPMTGGLTNTNFRVDVGGTPYFVRIPGAGTELLAVDRVNEIHNARAAAETGVAPPLLHVLPDDNVMVFGFVDGRTMSIESLQADGMPGRIAASLQRLHAGPRFHQDFDMFRLIEFYLETAERYAVRIPDDYRDYLGTVARIEQAVQHRALPAVPCHNDLLAELCSAYFGQATASLLARMRLFALMSDVGWTLWGAIQVRVSTLDYDFWGYDMGRWNRALGILNGPQLDEWLEQA